MPTATIYQRPAFPAVLKWQAIAFMRMEWPFIFQGELKFLSEIYPPESNPVHFVIAEGDSLLSYATIMRLDLEHAGKTYKVYGFGNMFTFPPYRGEGHGTQVLTLATDFIQQSEVDIAILFCDPSLEPFYGAAGWEPTNSETRVGQAAHYHTHDVLRMIYFVSDKGRQARQDFDEQPLYVEWTW